MQGSLATDNQRAMQLLQQLQQMEQFFKTPQPTLNPESPNPVINNLPKPTDTNKADAVNPKK